MHKSEPETEQPSDKLPHRPLQGRAILITRALAQSEELTSTLTNYGAHVLHCPTIEITEPDNWNALDQAIERLDSYDWVMFTSANGVEFFFRRLADKGIDYPPDQVSTFAIGPATAKSLRERNARVDLIAEDSKAEGALAALIARAGNEENLRGLRFLIPRARVAREYLPRELSSLGAHVDEVETYQTVKPDVDGQKIVKIFEEQIIDVITFTSSSTVSNFASLIGTKDLSGLLKKTLVACIGPVTAATASEYGLNNILQPETYTTSALVEAIIKSLGNK